MSSYRPGGSAAGGGPTGSRGRSSQAPRGYVPGLGRGAAGFTTRSDIGPMAAARSGAAGGAGSDGLEATSGTGSRAAELRAAKLQMKKMQQAQASADAGGPSPFGAAPKGYVAGAGRGAGFKAGDDDPGGPTGRAPGDDEGMLGSGPYDDDDEEADRIYGAVDERMANRGGTKRKAAGDDAGGGGGPAATTATASRVGDQFRELKAKLADVTEDQWAAIPDVGDYSLRHKQRRREDVFTPLTDSLLESRAKLSGDATGNATLAGTAQVADVDGTASTAPGGGAAAKGGGAGYQSVVKNMSGLAEARGTVLGMSLDKMSDSVSGQTVVDPKGYLTSLSTVKLATDAEIGDIARARQLLKSVRDTNPSHGPGWIAAARVEEAAGRTHHARKLIQGGCDSCPDDEDVWLEAARLHPPESARTILAAAVRRIPTSVKIFLKAAELENNDAAKRAVLRKGLESNPASVTLWKSAVELEDADDARILLGVAVEKVPHSVEMWLALARLETYENARKVLNRARRALPAERAVWIAAAKLEEAHDQPADVVDKIVDKAVRSLEKHDAVVSRGQWLKEAEAAEAAGAPLTAAAVVRRTVGRGVDPEDRLRTWADDAAGARDRGATATSRAILAVALAAFPTKRALWTQAVELERRHGTPKSLDEVLAAASERLPRTEIFWLMRAKERWVGRGDVEGAREVLAEAFAANPDSEAVWLAAAKLEWETGEAERARVLLRRARDRAPTARVYMKSALLERENGRHDDALDLVEEGIGQYPTFAKLYMMGGQICSDDLGGGKYGLDRARKFYQRGLQSCPTNAVLWVLASRLEERAPTFDSSVARGGGVTKARSLLELARLKNPKTPELWVEAARLERRAGNDKLASALMARALQDCPSSGLLLAESISTAPRPEQKSRSADAIKRCPDDPRVIEAVADLFASDRKVAKARKWYERAVALDPDRGDSWARYYAFETDAAAKERGKGGEGGAQNVAAEEKRDRVKERCEAADPRHGEVWCAVTKHMAHRRKSPGEKLELVAERISGRDRQQLN